jgi:hypothetical protein
VNTPVMTDCNLEKSANNLDSPENNYLVMLGYKYSAKQDYIVDCLASNLHSAKLVNSLEKLENRQDSMGCNLD